MKDKENQHTKIVLLTFFYSLITIIVYSFLRIIFLKNGYEYGVDVFYHIKMAELYPEVCMSKVFPWTQLSIWKTNFYDKELGFHFLLSLITSFKSFWGLRLFPPFNFVSIILFSIFALIFAGGCLVNRLKFSFIAVPLVTFISPLFLLRMNMIRAHALAITIFCVVIFLLISQLSCKKKLIYFFLLTFLFTFCYSVPHLILIPVIAYGLCRFMQKKADRKKTGKISGIVVLFIVAVLGILAALTLHPQFPNSFYCWYIQGVLVIKKMLGSGNINIWLGTEMVAPSYKTLAQNISVFMLLLVNMLLLFFNRKQNSHSVYFLFLIELIMTAGFLMSERSIEYAVPSGVLCFVFLLDGCLKNFKTNKSKKLSLIIGGNIIIIFTFFAMFSENRNYLKQTQLSPCYSFANWAKNKIKPGTYIGQIRWGEFPRLFYPASQFYYSMAMDPMFSYYVYPGKTVKLEKFRMLKQAISPIDLAEVLETDLVFISSYDPVPARHLITEGAKILYKGNDGWLLELR